MNKDDVIVGYIRDFMGPVTADDNCACDPLSVTLTFNSDLTVRNVVSVTPLQKYGHEPLTDGEHQQMVSIVQNPSVDVLNLSAPQDMIDQSSHSHPCPQRNRRQICDDSIDQRSVFCAPI